MQNAIYRRKSIRIGQLGGLLLIVSGIFSCFSNGFFSGLWLILVGGILLASAYNALAHRPQSVFDDIQIGQVMQKQAIVAPATISVQQLLDEYLIPYGLPSIPITQGDTLIGLVSLQDLKQVPQERRAITPVGYMMRLREQIQVSTPTESLTSALQLMSSQNLNRLPVVESNTLVGSISHESIVRYLEMKQEY